MSLLRFCIKDAILSVILIVIITQILTEGTNASKCPSTFGINISVDFNDSHVPSNCESGERTGIYSKLTEHEIREMETIVRDDIKNEILQKLGFLEPPIGLHLKDTIKRRDIKYIKNLLRPDFFEKETDIPEYKYKVLFAEKVTIRQTPDGDILYYFMTYKLDSEMTTDDIKTVDLWFFNGNYDRGKNMFSIVITEYARESGQAIEQSRGVLKEGGRWNRVSLNASRAVETFVSEYGYRIEIKCLTCKNGSLINVRISYGMLPFIVITMKTSSDKSTIEKHEFGRPSKFRDACTWPITFEFKSSELHNWIVLPASFSTNYCSGSCTSDYDEKFCNFSTVKRIASRNKSTIRICCSPTVASSLEIAYLETSHSVVLTTIPDVIVKECGCR